MKRALEEGVIIPSFNIPHLQMIAPIAQAIVEEDSVAFIAVARVEWVKFDSGSADAVREEYEKNRNPEHTRLHLDHIPVVDEDDVRVDYLPLIRHALDIGFDSVMVDGSRLTFEENVAATHGAAAMAHEAGRPIEAELGAVFGHEGDLPPSYEDIFASKRGFTDPAAARDFVARTGCDWLSVAIGSIHGGVSTALKDVRKVTARLDLEHLARISEAAAIPLVLHGGSGIDGSYVRESAKLGISKMNIGTELRQIYEQVLRKSRDLPRARAAVHERARWYIHELLGVNGSRQRLGS